MIAITLRLDDSTYESLRTEAFEKRTTITTLIRESLTSVEGRIDDEAERRASRYHEEECIYKQELSRQAITNSPFRANPKMPLDEQLMGFFNFAGKGCTGLRAVWRAGCDAGMVAK